MAPLSKRPRGIKQPKAFNPESSAAEPSPAKKAKTTESDEGGAEQAQPTEHEDAADSPEEIWEDAKDLWERAMEAAGESDPAPAVPLLRGIIHEFDRILRNSEDSSKPLQPASASASAQPSSSSSEPVLVPISSRAFFHIYATSLSTLGLLLSQLPSLAHPSEPSPLEFQSAALDFFAQARSATPSSPVYPEEWKLLIAEGRTLVLSATEVLDGMRLPEDPDDEESASTEELAAVASSHLKKAISLFDAALPLLPSTVAPPPTAKSASPLSVRDPITTYLTTSPFTLSLRLRTLLSLGTSVGVLLDRVDSPSDRLSFATWADALLARVGDESQDVKEGEWAYEVAVGRGALWLGVGGREAEVVEEQEEGERDTLKLQEYLEKALGFLKLGRELKPLKKQSGAEGEEDELSPMLVEAALTLGGLVFGGEEEQEVKRREELEELARAEGWSGEEEEEEDEDEEEEGDE